MQPLQNEESHHLTPSAPDEPRHSHKPVRHAPTGWFGVKIWEERPLSLYIYLQLYYNWTPIGARLLAHRGLLPEECEPRVSLATFTAPSPSQTTQTDLESKASNSIIRSSTASQDHIDLAKQWIEACRANHTACETAQSRERELPTRLIYVEPTSTGPPVMRLQETRTMKSKIEYLAFSHCWGGSQTFRLLPENYHSSIHSIDFPKLSKNAQDAVAITRALGYLYLWIDSVCIIQGPDGDWSTEAPRMGDVYSGAVCTIASTGSSSGDDGCYHERDVQSLLPCTVAVSSLTSDTFHSVYVRRDDILDFERHVDRSPLNKRAWAVQERLLSPRILHFGAEMLYWECRCRSASEISPHGYVYRKHSDFDNTSTTGDRHNQCDEVPAYINRKSQPTTQAIRGALIWREKITNPLPRPAIDPDEPNEPADDLTEEGYRSILSWGGEPRPWKESRTFSASPWASDAMRDEDQPGFHGAFAKLQNKSFSTAPIFTSKSFSNCWYDVVNLYSRGELTFQSDKLVALSGIAKEIQRATAYTYVLGLWKEDFLTNMLWCAIEGPGTRLKRETDLVHANSTIPSTPAPTWSWASLNAVIGLKLAPEGPDQTLRAVGALAVIVSSPGHTSLTSDPVDEYAPEGALILQGRLVPALKMKDSNMSGLNNFWYHAKVVQDIVEKDLWNEIGVPKLFFLPILHLSRKTADKESKEVQGLVLKYILEGPNSIDTFQRVGFFSSSGGVSIDIWEALTKGRMRTIYIV